MNLYKDEAKIFFDEEAIKAILRSCQNNSSEFTDLILALAERLSVANLQIKILIDKVDELENNLIYVNKKLGIGFDEQILNDCVLTAGVKEE